jgi:hypothetical protein
MKKVFNHIIAIGVMLFMATSCTDVLNQQSVDSFNQDVVFADVNIVKSYLGKCYDRMGGNTDNGVLGMREDLLSSATDQTLCIHRPSNYVNLKGTMSPDQLGYFNNTGYAGWLMWGNLYSNIQNLNTIIASVDGVKTTNANDEALKGRLKGEALFIRAYSYATLLMNYGGAVLTKDPYKLGQDFTTITRATIAQTKDFVLADIDQAITLLPATMEQGRANRAAAAALKARVLLFCGSALTNGGYESANTLVSFPAGSQIALLQAARDAAKLIMDGTYGAFSLVGSTADPVLPLSATAVKTYTDNFAGIFTQKGKWNSETIWGIQYPLTGGNINNANIWMGPCGYHNWGNNDPTEPAVRKFEMADGTPFVWDTYTPGNQFLRTATAAQLAADPLRNPYNGREPRFYATVLYHGAGWQARPSDAAGYDALNQVQTGHFYNMDGTVKAYGVDSRQGLIESWNGTKNGYYLKKFMDPATIGQYYRGTHTWVEFRYAEVLLSYAEACIELAVLGQTADLQNGINALNLVRNRAGLPDRVTTVALTARNYLRQERYIEFFAEGHQWYDMRRWMTAPSLITNVLEMKIKQYVNGDFEWKIDPAAIPDTRSWADNKYYWLPLSRDEMNKAPQLQQNPNY